MLKHLFAIDLDGTLLKNSKTNEISKKNKKMIKKLKDEGHIVCIVTGRSWRSVKKIYEDLNLDTVVANYNGSYIHNPINYDFTPQISYMHLNDILYVLGDKKLKKWTENVAIEGPGWVRAQKKNKDLERVFGFEGMENYKTTLNWNKIPLKPTGVIIDTKPNVNVLELKDHLERTYGDLLEFSSWSKGADTTPVFDMTAIGVSKGKALALLSRYYDVPIKRTVSIGDGYNDVPMFLNSEYSVAMEQSSEDIKAIATYTSTSNINNGLGNFIEKFLGDDEESKKFRSFLRKERKRIHGLKDATTTGF